MSTLNVSVKSSKERDGLLNKLLPFLNSTSSTKIVQRNGTRWKVWAKLSKERNY